MTSETFGGRDSESEFLGRRTADCAMWFCLRYSHQEKIYRKKNVRFSSLGLGSFGMWHSAESHSALAARGRRIWAAKRLPQGECGALLSGPGTSCVWTALWRGLLFMTPTSSNFSLSFCISVAAARRRAWMSPTASLLSLKYVLFFHERWLFTSLPACWWRYVQTGRWVVGLAGPLHSRGVTRYLESCGLELSLIWWCFCKCVTKPRCFFLNDSYRFMLIRKATCVYFGKYENYNP